MEDFETIGQWTAGGTVGGSIAADTTNVKTGSASLTVTAPVSGNHYATKTVSLDLTGLAPIQFSFYVASTTNIATITFYLSNDSGFANYYSKAISTSGNFFAGWNTITIGRSQFSSTGTPSWNTTFTRVRVRIDAGAGGEQAVSFDSLYGGKRTRPKLVLTFDDGWDSVYSEAYAYMEPRGLVATAYINGVYIDEANRMTLANLRTLRTNGWSLGNHTYNHTNLTTLATQAEMEDEIQLGEDFLVSNGLTGAHKHFAYPNGGYNDTALAALNALGYQTARTTKGTAVSFTPNPPENNYLIRIQNLGNTDTLTAVKAKVDRVIEEGGVLFINGHKLVASATVSTEWAISDFQALIDYVYPKVLGGQLDMVNVDEWYNGLTNPRYKTIQPTRTAAVTRTAATGRVSI